MKKIISLLFCLLTAINISAQSQSAIISELEQTIKTYNVQPYEQRGRASGEVSSIEIKYDKPTIILYMTIDGFKWQEYILKFDLLKAEFKIEDRYFFVISCTENIDMSVTTINHSYYDRSITEKPIKYASIEDDFRFKFNGAAVGKKVLTGFQNLQSLAKQTSVQTTAPAIFDDATSANSKTIKMKKMSGNTFLIGCKVNGLPLDFIFDTGASDVTLSLTEALFMFKNGYLTESDIVGKQNYQTANGGIQAGTKVILRKIDINGNILYNVQASIIHTDNAPLLLGQSALSKLGTIQIDYQNAILKIIKE